MLDNGLTCVVIGNGPSLRSVPDAFLDGYPTFGGNGIFKRFPPDHYVNVDPDRSKFLAWMSQLNAMTSRKYILAAHSQLVVDSVPLHVIHESGFSFEPLHRVYGYFSVITVMLQLVCAMDYKTVLLVGLDHRYIEPEGKRAWHRAGQDVNHFVTDYYPGGSNWMAPDLVKLGLWFAQARMIFESRGKRIVNLTDGTALDVFEKGKVSEWM